MGIQKINFAQVQPTFKADNNNPPKEKQVEDTTVREEEHHTVRNWSIGLGAAATLITLGVLGRKGHLGKGMQRLLRGGENAAEHANPAGKPQGKPTVTDTVDEITEAEFEQITGRKPNSTHSESSVQKPAAEAAEETAALEKPTESITEKETTIAAEKETTAAVEKETAAAAEAKIAYVGENGVQSPIPKEEILNLPKVLETDSGKLIKMGKLETNYAGTRFIRLENVEGLYDRVYYFKDGTPDISHVLDFAHNETKPFRRIQFNDKGEPRSIFDGTSSETRVNHLETPSMKAAKAAREAAQNSYDAEMILKLEPQAKALIKDMKGSWTEEAARATRLYEKAEQDGFMSLKGAIDVMEDGTHRISFELPGGKMKYEYLSRDGEKLNEIKVYKDGKLSHEIEFYRSHESGRPLDITAVEESGNYGLCFRMDRKNPELVEYTNYNLMEDEALGKVHISGNQVHISYHGSKEKDVLGNSFWTDL